MVQIKCIVINSLYARLLSTSLVDGCFDGLDNILRDFDLLNNKNNNNSNNSNNICNKLEETRNGSRKGVKGFA